MPTNNILLFDQNKGNMMGDEAYSTNTQRLNGVQTGIASSQLQNKFQYQVSLVAYAIASLMYNNGLDANDANAVSAFVSNLSGTLVQKVLDKANTQEAQLGTVDTKWMSPALVKAAIDYCHANAITFGSNVTVGGNLLVSGTSKMNGAATFASTSTFTGAATFNGVAQGQSPTASSHFATKGYVDTKNNELLSMINPVLLYEDSFTASETAKVPAGTLTKFYPRICFSLQLQNGSTFTSPLSSYEWFYFRIGGTSGNDLSLITITMDNSISSFTVNGIFAQEMKCFASANVFSVNCSNEDSGSRISYTYQFVPVGDNGGSISITYMPNGQNVAFDCIYPVSLDAKFNGSYTFRLYSW